MDPETFSRPAQHKNAVLLCIDQHYVKYAAVLIEQIMTLMPDLDADICLASTKPLDLPDFLALYNLRVVVTDVEDQCTHFPVTESIPLASYLRLFAIDMLAPDYDRILYLDSDIMVQNTDLTDVFGIDLVGDTPLAAVRDPAQFKNPIASMPEMFILRVRPFPYFNAGVLLVDAKRWLEQGILDQVLKVIVASPQALHFYDQSALNIALKGRWTEMSHHWNWMTWPKLMLYLGWEKPSVIHFIGPEKPWDVDVPRVPAHTIAFYDEQLKKRFDIDPPVRNYANPGRKSQRSFLVGNLRNIRKFLRRRAKFASPLVTRDPNLDF